MNAFGSRCKINVFGDFFMQQLCPELRRHPGFEVEHEVTIKKGTIKKLHRTLLNSPELYNLRYPYGVALMMVGTQDVRYFAYENIKGYLKKMKQRLKYLIDFLKDSHRRVIILTALPLERMQYHFEKFALLRKYNKFIKGLTGKGLEVVDVFNIFITKSRSKGFKLDFYEGRTRGKHKDRWNNRGNQMVIDKILKAVVNVEQSKPSNAAKKIEKEEKFSNRSIMTNRVEDLCPTDGHQTHQCTSINYFKDVGGRDGDVSNVIGEMSFSEDSKDNESEESIYKARTRYLKEQIKQKLRRLRFTEYTKYGEGLMETNNLQSKKEELVTVASYNILSQELLEKHSYLYANHNYASLIWNVRREILIEELSLLDADILCLQEVDYFLFNPLYNSRLSPRGYRGIYKRKTLGSNDGCAIYFKNDKFDLVESHSVELFRAPARLLAKGNVGIVLKLSLKDRPEVELVVATTHLLYNPKRSDIRLAQTQIMLAEIERVAYKGWDHEKSRPEYLPIIFTGDMNYTPQSGVYELVTKSCFKYEGKPHKFLIPHTEGHPLEKALIPSDVGVTDSCQYLSSLSQREGKTEIKFESGCLEHPLNLSSVYSHSKKDLPEATTNQYEWLTVDYIYYSQLFNPEANKRSEGRLKLVSKLTLPNAREAETELESIPNLGCGSDHLPLLATFHLSNS